MIHAAISGANERFECSCEITAKYEHERTNERERNDENVTDLVKKRENKSSHIANNKPGDMGMESKSTWCACGLRAPFLFY